MVTRSEHFPTELQAASLVDNATLYDALKALEDGSLQIAFSCRQDGTLMGILTDGDIRRALLNGASLDAPAKEVLKTEFIRIRDKQSRTEALELMQALRIKQLPIVNEAGQLKGLHLIDNLISPVKIPNEAVLLAGGKGMRLRPITEHLPKPMLKVAGRPILERLVLHLAGHGIRRIHLATNFMGHVIEQHFQDGSRFGCQISYLRESEPLGTAGPLSLLKERPSEPLLVVNGDLVTQFDAGSLLDEHNEKGNDLTIGVKLYNHQVPFGCVSVEGERVVQLAEKPTISRLINAGIYVLSPQTLSGIPKNRNFPMTELINDLIISGKRVGTFELHDDWIDVGQKESLSLAREGA